MAFEDWKGDYALRMGGGVAPARLQAGSHAARFKRHVSEWTPERLRSLNYPGVAKSFALVLKNHGLFVPEAHEIGAVDVRSADAVRDFVARWAYENLSIPEALRLFAYRGFPDRFDRKLLMRNIVFRAWLWIRRGLFPKINNVVRRGWYEYVKPVLTKYWVLEAPDYDRYFEELRYLTRVPELGITYRDFGFIDHERGVFWDIGSKRPEVLLYAEKEELKGLFDEMNAGLSASYIVNHGQPNRFQVETLALEIAEAAPGKTVHLVSVVDFNPGGFAIEGAGVEGLTYHGVPVETHRVLELRALSEEQVEEFRTPLAEAVRSPDGTLSVTFGSEAHFRQCENWFARAVADPRFREEVPVPGGVKVTYYGFDMDILGEDWLRYRLRRILDRLSGRVVSRRPVGRVGGSVWPAWLADYRRAHGVPPRRADGRAVEELVAAAGDGSGDGRRRGVSAGG